MKIRNLLPGFALAALLALGMTGTAHAEGPYTCNEGNNPPPYDQQPWAGGITIVADSIHETCTLGDLVATDGIIGVTAGNATIGNISTSGSVFILLGGDSTTGNIETGSGESYISSSGNFHIGGTVTSDGWGLNIGGGTVTVDGAINGTGTSIRINSDGNISIPSVETTDGDVTVLANNPSPGTSPTNDPLTIGTVSSNGIGHIYANGDLGRFIYISNGGTGGISYSGTNNLQVDAASGQTGLIVLNGQENGPVTLAGTLSVDGGTGQSAGSLYVFAPEIIANGATINASSPGQQVGTINLITNLITDNSGLTINQNGDGSSPDFLNMSIMPVGSLTIDSAPPAAGDPIYWGAYSSSANPLSITGAGAFTINANGNNNAFNIIGYGLTVNPATTTITQHGSGNAVYLQATDGAGNFTTVTFGTMAVHENTTAPGQTLNNLEVDGTELEPLTGHVLLDTSGLTGGDGSNITLPYTSGALALGSTGNTVQIKADGSASGGKGGTVYAGFGGDLALTIQSGDAISASAKGGDGDGGQINIVSNSIANGSGSSALIAADAHGTGNGGKISATLTTDVNVSSATDAFAFEARAGSTGSGGEIDITANNITLDGTKVDVTALTNGKGGTLNIQAFGALNLTAGSLAASGVGSKDGGNITVDAQSVTFAGSAYSVSADAGTTQGNGGVISITSQGAIKTGTSAGAVQLNARGKGAGKGGQITLSAQPLTVSGAISVDGGSTNGTAGDIVLTSAGTGTSGLLTVNGTLNANGLGSGAGGTIQLIGDSLSLDSDQFTTNGGATGKGGRITISSTGSTAASLAGTGILIQALGGTSSGNGGDININANGINASGTIDASARGTSGNAGSVTISSGTGDFNGTGVKITANGNYNGTAPSISISATVGVIDLGDLNTNGATVANGNGGYISLSVPQGYVTLHGVASAIGSGSGKGGKIAAAIPAGAFTTASAGVLVDSGPNAGTGNNGGTITLDAQTHAIAGPLSANGKNLSDGGAISVTATDVLGLTVGGQTTADGGVGSSSGNAQGGSINIQTTSGSSGSVNINNMLSAKGQGNGRGGTITVAGYHANFTGATVVADGGSSGHGGIINVTSRSVGNLHLSSGSISATSSAASAPVGQISLSSGGNITLDSAVTITAAGTGSGAGGQISLITGMGQSFANQAKLVNSGNVTANGGTNAAAGTIAIQAIDTELVSGASISADANGTGTPGSVTITPTPGVVPSAMVVNGQGLVSAVLGTLSVNNGSANSISITVADLEGKVQATGNFVDVTVASNSDLIFGNVVAQKDITLKNTGTGNVLTSSGSTLSGRTLILQPGVGNVGSISDPLNTSVTGLTSTAQSGSGSVYVKNSVSGLLTINDGASSNGALSVESSNGLTSNSINAGADGSGNGIILIADGGTLNVNSVIGSFGATLQTNGMLQLKSNSLIVIGPSDRFLIQGDIMLSIGGAAGTNNVDPSGRPANVSVTNNGTIYWNAGLNALSAMSVTNVSGRTITVDPNGTMANITIGGNTAINTVP